MTCIIKSPSFVKFMKSSAKNEQKYYPCLSHISYDNQENECDGSLVFSSSRKAKKIQKMLSQVNPQKQMVWYNLIAGPDVIKKLF